MYDAINGLAGIGRVLLAALTAGYDTAESGLLAALRTLTSMIDTPYGRRLGWMVRRWPARSNPERGALAAALAHGRVAQLGTLRHR